MRLIRALEELIRQPEVILSLIGIAIALLLGLTSIDPTNPDAQFQAGVLGVLGAIAATQIAVSYSELQKNKEMTKLLQAQAQTRVEDVIRMHSEFYDQPLNPTHVRRYDSFFCTGISQRQFLLNNSENLVRILRDGGSLYVILPDPNDLELVEQIANTAAQTFTAQGIRRDINTTLGILAEIDERREGRGSLNLGFIHAVPMMNLIVMEAGTQQGRVVVELYHYKSYKKDRLHFMLDKSKDLHYYQIFRKVVEELKRDADLQNRIPPFTEPIGA